jgi:hypothetical protein
MKTAVEWYEKEIDSLIEKYESKEISKADFIIMKHNLLYPAKEMEKQQIYESYDYGFENPNVTGEQYYNETFKSE